MTDIPEFFTQKTESGDIIWHRKDFLGKGSESKVYILEKEGISYAGKITTDANKKKKKKRIENEKTCKDVELEAYKELKHPNIIKFVTYFEDGIFQVIVLELCNRENLLKVMEEKKKRIREEEIKEGELKTGEIKEEGEGEIKEISEWKLQVKEYMLQIISAIEYMHDSGWIHRDLKLGNIFLDKDNRIKIGDFDLSVRIEDTPTNILCGTPNYISPEVLQRKGYDNRIDIWSIGVILYALLVFKCPFHRFEDSPDVKETYKAIKKGEFTFPENAKITEYQKSLIKWILNVDPENRPSLSDIRERIDSDNF